MILFTFTITSSLLLVEVHFSTFTFICSFPSHFNFPGQGHISKVLDIPRFPKSYHIRKLGQIDAAYNGTRPGEVGPCVARLETFGELLELVVGAFGEVSTDLDRVITAMAESRVLFLSRESGKPVAEVGGQFGTGTNLAPESIWHQECKRVNLAPVVRVLSDFEGGSPKSIL